MGYQEAYRLMWQKGFQFKGRASLAEYWKPFLINVVLSILAFTLEVTISHAFALLIDLYGLAVLIPSLSLLVRRLHDTNRSGWWWFIDLVPLVGFLVLLYFLAQPSSIGANRYDSPT
jgi:uncharacterized membrane protein YhaH (DUF805 family)